MAVLTAVLLGPISAQTTYAQTIDDDSLSANNAQATRTLFRFTAKPRSDLPAFNFIATTTESPCEKNCVHHWRVNQRTKVITNSSRSTSISKLQPNRDYVVEWISSDAKQPVLINEIKIRQ